MEPRLILLILIVVAVLLVGIVFIRRRGKRRGPTSKGSPAIFGQSQEPTTSIPRSTQRVRTGLIDRAGGQLSGRFQTITQRRTTRASWIRNTRVTRDRHHGHRPAARSHAAAASPADVAVAVCQSVARSALRPTTRGDDLPLVDVGATPASAPLDSSALTPGQRARARQLSQQYNAIAEMWTHVGR